MGADRTRMVAILLPALAATVAGLAYSTTLLPGVGHAGDVAKFQFVGHVLGTPHAPGYPLYTLFSYVFTHAVPFGSVAWRANLLSAIFAMLAVLMLTAVMRRLGCSPWVAATMGLVTGLLPAVWSQAVIAEVYTLHLLFVVATLWLLLRWQSSRRWHDLVKALAVFCLAFAHHLTMVTLVPAVVAFVLMIDHLVARPRRLATLLPLPLLGVLPYGYLFWRTAQSTTTYLEIQTPNLETWLWYLRGAQFRDRIFAFSPVEMLTERLPLLASFALHQLAPSHAIGWRVVLAMLMLTIVGIGIVVLRDTARHVLLLGTFTGNTIYALGYDIPDLGAYLIPSYVVILIYAGLGLEHAIARTPRTPPRRRRVATLWLLPLLPVTLFLLHRPAMDRSADHAASTRARAMLETIDVDAGTEGQKIIIADDYLGYETLQYARLIGLDGTPRPDLFVMTPMLDENADAAIDAYVAQHQPPPLVRDQLESAHRPSTVVRYFTHGGTLQSFEARSTAPLDLPVYAIGNDAARQLEAIGLQIRALDHDVFHISPAEPDAHVP